MRASQNELFTRSEPGTVVVIRNFATEHSLTMIMVTHQIGFAREISDRVCFILRRADRRGKQARQAVHGPAESTHPAVPERGTASRLGSTGPA